MIETRHDGTEIATRVDEDELIDRVKRALSDARNRSVEVHRPGAIRTRSNGRRYQLNEHGHWERLDK